MKTILAIGSGSFFGGVFRYLVYSTIQGKAQTSFPLGTLIVNLIGCLFIGLIIGLGERTNINQEWRFFLATGLCGGFTTFSAFSLETVGLLKTGNINYALVYISASVLLGILATFLGFTIIKMF